MIEKLSAGVQKLCFSRLKPKFDDSLIKTSSNHTKLRREDHKGLENNLTEGIDESIHGLEGIDDLAIKSGVFSIDRKTQELGFQGARDS